MAALIALLLAAAGPPAANAAQDEARLSAAARAAPAPQAGASGAPRRGPGGASRAPAPAPATPARTAAAGAPGAVGVVDPDRRGASGAAASPPAVTRWRPLIEAAAQRFGLPPGWIERVLRAESGGRTHLAGRPITSRAGAMGLMQLMPGTWALMRARLGLGDDPHDPHDNILAGSLYLRLMYDRFGYPGLFGAYNAGPGRYAAWRAGRRPLPGETRAYLAKLGGTDGANALGDSGAEPAGTARAAIGPPPTLFAVRKGEVLQTGLPTAPAMPALFVRLSAAQDRADEAAPR